MILLFPYASVSPGLYMKQEIITYLSVLIMLLFYRFLLPFISLFLLVPVCYEECKEGDEEMEEHICFLFPHTTSVSLGLNTLVHL